MKRRIWIGFLLVVLTLVSAFWLYRTHMMQMQHSDAGFRIVSVANNGLLISDADVVSYNWTSQEIAITSDASERLRGIGDSLYNFSGFVIKIDGEELYRGVFRNSFMSAIPASPRISIMFPAIVFPSENENYFAVRMFFPFFQPPSDQPEANAKLAQHFETEGKLRY